MILPWLFLFHSLLGTDRVQVVDLNQWKNITQVKNDTLYVVNFWATWCKPCVEEMPDFIKTIEKHKHEPVKLVFVSLNSVKEKQTVENFVIKNKIAQQVLLLNAGNPNVWINQIEPEWGGSIPATLFYKNEKKLLFHEGEMNAAQLDSIINHKK